MGFRESNKWEREPFDPTEADSTDEAVFIGQQATGVTVVIGRDESEEWLKTSNMAALPVEKYR